MTCALYLPNPFLPAAVVFDVPAPPRYLFIVLLSLFISMSRSFFSFFANPIDPFPLHSESYIAVYVYICRHSTRRRRYIYVSILRLAMCVYIYNRYVYASWLTFQGFPRFFSTADPF
ncbi:hypothetical protein CSUI_004795 [Cystoisospora suis]|uniref:Transmembrane protein n=1 Tax=Cystoisospora suis TaxID=483139 RepID=A0A2C6KZW1_9APIC|nr:hypothetical protein CSUI_004795 [Cystoisospora suis]